MTVQSPLPISVCLIAGNEAHRIRRALESINGWTSETIVVLNDDVSDGTDKLAMEFGARIFREPWKGHIAQKNSAAEKATQEWILGLDADEAISPELCAEIRQQFAAPDRSARFAAYSFPRCSFYCGRWIRHGDWYPDRQTRLWQKGRARWGGIDPHDKLLVKGLVGRLHQDLLHFPMESINHQIAKTVKYTDDFVRHYQETGKTVGFADLLVRPLWRFARAYLLRLGFLDGWQGFSIAWLTAFYTFLRYAKVRESQLPKMN